MSSKIFPEGRRKFVAGATGPGLNICCFIRLGWDLCEMVGGDVSGVVAPGGSGESVI